MKKVIKVLCLIVALMMALSMFAGCKKVEDDEYVEEETQEPIDLTIAIPVSAEDPEWEDWKSVLSVWQEDMNMFSQVKLKFETIPDLDDEKAMKKFKQKIDTGKIGMVFTERGDFVNDLMESDSIINIGGMQSTFSAIMETSSPFVYSLSQEEDLTNFMFPIYGEFQGLYYNRTKLKELKIENPTSWDALLAAIKTLKENNVTPIAAGFADEGLDYFMEEIILAEGGTAEHSYTPTFGVMSSWERAVADMKTLQAAGAFSADCFDKSFEDAVADFLNGDAAMIVAPSDAFEGELSLDDVKVVPFPKTPTGKKEDGAFIGRYTHGVYVSRAYFYSHEERGADAVFNMLTEYFNSPDFYALFEDESTIHADVAIYDEIADCNFDDSLKSLLKNAKAADWQMSEYANDYEAIMNGFRKALTGTDVTEALQAAADAEIAAAEAKAEAEKKAEK